MALQESQGALTTLQRELIEVLQEREEEEEENKGKGIPKKVANLKREMKECETALAMQRGQYLFLHKILAKERRQFRCYCENGGAEKAARYFREDLSCGDLRVILGPGVVQQTLSKSAHAAPAQQTLFRQERTGSSLWLSRLPRELQWDGQYLIQMPGMHEIRDLVTQLWLSWDRYSANVKQEEEDAQRGGSTSAAEARVAKLCEEGRKKATESRTLIQKLSPQVQVPLRRLRPPLKDS